jgi:hypothetical protein
MRITEYGVRNSTRSIETFCEFELMRKGLLYIIMTVTVIFATAVQAQEGAAEKDPFHPSTGRPVAIVPGPASGDDSWGRDPFNNPLAGKPPEQKMAPSPGSGRMLTGIIFSKDVRLAIIGGETYQEGVKVGDRKLVEIRGRSVVFIGAAGEKEEVFLSDFTMNK